MEVRKSLPYFKKGAQGHNYKYVAGVDILIAIQDKMNEHGLVLYPEIHEPEARMIGEVKNKKFGDDYLNWSKKVPAFFPCYRKYIKGEICFSSKT